MQKVEFSAMGSTILVALDNDDQNLVSIMGTAREWFEQWEQIFSRFRPDSELTRLNGQKERFVQVSDTFWSVFQHAIRIEEWTGGMVSPFVLDALENAGYETSFDLLNKDQYQVDRGSGLDLGCEEGCSLDPSNQSIRLSCGTRIDLGGFAKGWAAHQIMLRLREYAPVLVDAGGDIAISAPMKNGAPWRIGIARAFDGTGNAEVIEVNRGGVATSGIDRRRWKVNGKWQHHIIDPRTNSPAETDIVNVTVIAADVLTAEVATKAAILMGSEIAQKWLSAQGLTQYLMQLKKAENEGAMHDNLSERIYYYEPQ